VEIVKFFLNAAKSACSHSEQENLTNIQESLDDTWAAQQIGSLSWSLLAIPDAAYIT
jgi:hypothetical protein